MKRLIRQDAVDITKLSKYVSGLHWDLATACQLLDRTLNEDLPEPLRKFIEKKLSDFGYKEPGVQS
jgi:hypothetical protein